MYSTGWKILARGCNRSAAILDASNEAATWDRGRPARIRFREDRRLRLRANALLLRKLTRRGKSKAECKGEGRQRNLDLSLPDVKPA
jgi:hypothetical protein